MKTEREVLNDIETLKDPTMDGMALLPSVKLLAADILHDPSTFQGSPLDGQGALLQGLISGIEARSEGRDLSVAETVAFARNKEVLGALNDHFLESAGQYAEQGFGHELPILDEAIIATNLAKQGKFTAANERKGDANFRQLALRSAGEDKALTGVVAQLDGLLQQLGKANPDLGIPLDDAPPIRPRP